MPSSIKNAYVPITEINKLLIFCHTFCIIFERGSPNQDKMQERKARKGIQSLKSGKANEDPHC